MPSARSARARAWFKTASRPTLFYRVIYRITDVKIPVDTGDFRLMDRKVVDVMKQMREKYRFLRGMTSWVGFRQVGVPYGRRGALRRHDEVPVQAKCCDSRWTPVTGFSYFPLQIMVYVSLVLGHAGAVGDPGHRRAALIMGRPFLGGQATTVILLLLMSSFQLFFLFILGQYVARTYDEGAQPSALYRGIDGRSDRVG